MENFESNIPKIIHYCWFGENEMPPLATKCIESWKKYFPEFEIKLWNESNIDIDSCDYVKKAYEQKKWAFVSDYARFWILYNYGGVYLDTDVEVIRDFSDLLQEGSFMACEEDAKFSEYIYGITCPVAPGLCIAAEPKLKVFEMILDRYNDMSFSSDSNETVVHIVTKLLYENGFKGHGNIENVMGLTIYPPEYFGTKNKYSGKVVLTGNSVAIHHYMASWQGKSVKLKIMIQKFIGPTMTNLIIAAKRRLKSYKGSKNER